MASKLQFGQYIIRASQVFFQSDLSMGLVNLKPVVPGHVLIIPKRVVHRFKDLTNAEVADLWISAQTISNVIERHFKADSLTFAIQDGVAAGQTVFHVHIHIIPRRPGDFEQNDDVYREIEKDRKNRTEDEMAEEASALSALFSNKHQPS